LLDFQKIKTWSARNRVNLVTIDKLLPLHIDGDVSVADPDFTELAQRIRTANRNGRPVIIFIGAHVIKSGLSLYLIELMKRGIVTHIAGNGAVSIHDFEIGYLGGTSEDVPCAIEDGSFGMWEETGAWMNEALQQGAKQGLGYGAALGRYIDEHQDRFPHRDQCVLYQAWKLGVPATYHIAIGTDIIHQHPTADFSVIGCCTGEDFKRFTESVSGMDGGVFLNFGSAVIGPEVFLKALSISRNLGFPTFRITTANFDLKDLHNYRCKLGYDDPDYYYRPRKNIVNRPTSCGGKGWHFVMDHKESIPMLLNAVIALQRRETHAD
jgi:hypothetical protein